MKKICLLFSGILLFFNGNVNGQETECGTISKTDEEMEIQKWYGNNAYLEHLLDSIKFYEPNPLYLEKSALINEVPQSNYKVPIQFWIYRDANGNDNGMNETYVQRRIDELNELYLNEGTQIQYYSTCEIKYIDDDDYLDLSDDEEKDIIKDNYIDGVINVHFVRTFGSAGVFWQFISKAGVIISQTASASTLAHEIGHYFNLEHTHRNCDEGKCRQEAVSRSRTFTLWENIHCAKFGTICDKNGDGLCDTPADPQISSSSFVTGMPNCLYIDVTEEDNWGDLYSSNPPDVHNIMSYSMDRNCRDNFTSGQIGVMIDKLLNRGFGHSFLHPIERYMFDRYEPDNTATTARVIPLNTLQHHTFHWSNEGDNEVRTCDVDWLLFNIQTISQGKLLQIVTDNGIFEDADTELWLYSSADLTNHIAYDDNSNGNGYSSIVMQDLPVGDYFIKVMYKTNPPYNSVIDYTIKVQECVSDYTCVSGIVKSGEIKIYYARQLLTSPCPGESFVVEAGGEVIFISEHEINLEPGFEVEQGAHFETILAPIGEEACFNNELLKNAVNRLKNRENTETQSYLSSFIVSDTANYKAITKINEPISIKNNLTVFPNPSDGTFTISFDLSGDQNINIRIYSICGNSIKDIAVNQFYTKGNHKIDINEKFSLGVYFCELLTEKERIIDKIIIKGR